ncbi:hypothetical protein [uncultured Salipiger sp.]|uniref:hypothetical protein n=1 Tax=uncultured Salipiger sp. TaxID=499810 RepID=UPI002595CB0E|nr:hypothetical protein [uncultured Salipiger sp.]
MPSDMTFRTLLRPAALVMALALCPLVAAAQEPDERDLQALRFYMNENNEQAIQSELRRLQIQFPAWTPPADLDALEETVPSEAIKRIYSLIADEDYAGAREAIAETGSDYPDWSPSSDLLTALSLAESQSEFNQAVLAGNRQAAIRIARSTPALLSCERVNNAWQLAEQYEALGDASSALVVYRGIAGSCTDVDVLIATLEKSAASADAAQLAELADTMRVRVPNAEGRLSVVENRLRAGLGAEPRELPGVPLSNAPLTALEVPLAPTPEVRPSARPANLGVVPVRRSAPASTGSGSSSGGGGGGGGAVSSSVARAAQAGDWQTCLALTANARAAEDISQRGWCAFNAGRPMQALRDFRSATANARNATLRRDSAYGLALTMMRLRMVNEAAAVAASTDFTYDQRLEVESEILDARGVAAYNRGEYRRAIGYFNEYERLTGRVRRDLAMLRGYAYMNSGQKAKAAAEFQRLHDQLATPETRAALSTALR